MTGKEHLTMLSGKSAAPDFINRIVMVSSFVLFWLVFLNYYSNPHFSWVKYLLDIFYLGLFRFSALLLFTDFEIKV